MDNYDLDRKYVNGAEWTVIIVYIKRDELFEVLFKLMQKFNRYMPHYTIRDYFELSDMYVASFRIQYVNYDFIKDYMESLKRYEYYIVCKDHNEVKDAETMEYHAWAMPETKSDHRDMENCDLLHDLSSLSIRYGLSGQDKCEYIHLLCNMLGMEEVVRSKFSKKLGFPIIGTIYLPSYKLYDENKGVYWDKKFKNESETMKYMNLLAEHVNAKLTEIKDLSKSIDSKFIELKKLKEETILDIDKLKNAKDN